MKKGWILGGALLLLCGCSFPTYEWRHPQGLEQTTLERDKEECYRYANQAIPPSYYFDDAFLWADPYGDLRWPYHRHPYYPHSFSYHYPGYWGFSSHFYFRYRDDIFKACMKGKGWRLERVEESNSKK